MDKTRKNQMDGKKCSIQWTKQIPKSLKQPKNRCNIMTILDRAFLIVNFKYYFIYNMIIVSELFLIWILEI